MSGFFMVERGIVAKHAPRLSPDGFKILVDLLMSARSELTVVETPYVFRPREAGESKLSALVGLEFLGLIAHHWLRGLVSTRFVLFAMVGGVGVLVHLVSLTIFLAILTSAHFRSSQGLATLVALMSNFILNNEITYRARRFKGAGLFWGFALFAALCSVGVFANLDISSWLFRREGFYWGVAGVAGALVNVVWNYAVSTTFVWRRRS
jgi:dolichol-phosphate mannosyltransferase